jgi:hypothetical protein
MREVLPEVVFDLHAQENSTSSSTGFAIGISAKISLLTCGIHLSWCTTMNGSTSDEGGTRKVQSKRFNIAANARIQG